jgi:hypothetical protein
MTARPRRGPAKRLLILPTLLALALLAGLHLVRETVTHPVDTTLALVDLPPVAGEPIRCVRGEEPAAIGEVRRQLRPRGRVTSAMVVACPMAFDGLHVTYVGELVGDLLPRHGGAWILVNDDDYALEVGPLTSRGERRGTNSGLTVWLPEDLLPEVTGLGQPKQRGDVVAVRGPIVRTDPADGGGLTLRAESLAVLAPALPVPDPFDARQAALAVGAALAGAALWIFRRRTVQR